MVRFTAIKPAKKVAMLRQDSPRYLENNPHGELAQRVVAGPHFVHSPLLSKFLLFVVAETLAGRASEITEHQIGVQVFDRPPDYRTLEDNIVRSYARLLRKRLAEHFANQGKNEPVRIEIPLGGYVPVFIPASESCQDEETWAEAGAADGPEQPQLVSARSAKAGMRFRLKWKVIALGAALAVAYSAGIIGLTWHTAVRARASGAAQTPAHRLWAALFGGPANCYIIPSDAGFNLLEDLSHRPVPLAEYVGGDYQDAPLAGIDAHSAQDLRTQELTPFVDLEIAAELAHLPEESQQRVSVRFPRDLRLDDLKRANAIIIGSVSSNPWASIAEFNANFRIVDRPGMQSATILNLKPQAGEAASYESHWNEPAHETFALIGFLPNLSGNGHLLVLEGLDAAGTQAAAEMLLHPSAIDPILQRAARPDGSLRNFEVLLGATSIGSSAMETRVIASRIY